MPEDSDPKADADSDWEPKSLQERLDEWETIHGGGKVHSTDREIETAKYMDRSDIIEGMAGEDLWKTSGGDTYVREEFQQYV